MARRLKATGHILAYGILLGNFAISASYVFRDFAPVSMTPIWLYLASAVVGAAMAWTFNDVGVVFGGIAVIGLIAVLILSGALVGTAQATGPMVLDVMLLYAFQQSFPWYLAICVCGGTVAGAATMFGYTTGRLS